MSASGHPEAVAPAAMADGEAALWEEFRTARSDSARHRLFELHIDLARAVARRHFKDRSRGDIEYPDLVQWACTGLLGAIDHFDSTRGVPFRAYARKRIGGSIVDGIGKTSEFREQLRFYKRHQAERIRSLQSDVGPSADVAESYDAFAQLVVGLALGFMLDDAAGAGMEGEPNAYESLAWKETVEIVHEALDALPERERLILRGHYEGALSFDQLGSMLGLTKGRISQLHRAALLTLRKRLQRANPFTYSR